MSTPAVATAYGLQASDGTGANVLAKDQTLHAGENLHSSGGQFDLWMQADGNLVLYRSDGAVVWDNLNPRQPRLLVDHARRRQSRDLPTGRDRDLGRRDMGYGQPTGWCSTTTAILSCSIRPARSSGGGGDRRVDTKGTGNARTALEQVGEVSGRRHARVAEYRGPGAGGRGRTAYAGHAAGREAGSRRSPGDRPGLDPTESQGHAGQLARLAESNHRAGRAARCGGPLRGRDPPGEGRYFAGLGRRCPRRDRRPLSSVDVQVVDRATVPAAWRDGLVMRVSAPQGANAGAARLSVDYRAFQQAYGADWASRLKLWRVPQCALTTPDAAACRSVPLPTATDPAGRHRHGDGERRLGGGHAGGLKHAGGAGRGVRPATTATSAPPRCPRRATWSAGGNVGRVLLVVPDAGAAGDRGPRPTIALSYSSSAVDGRSEATNNQPSWVGEGFDYCARLHRARYMPCDDDHGQWREQHRRPPATSAGGRTTRRLTSRLAHSGELIYEAGKGWHCAAEDGSRIEKLTGAANGDTATTTASTGGSPPPTAPSTTSA